MNVNKLNVLDNPLIIKTLDTVNVLGSIDSFPQQCHQVLTEIEKLSLHNLKNKVDNIYLCK